MKYATNSTIELPPTGRQCQRIALQCMALGIKEPLEEKVSSRREARDLIWELRNKMKGRSKKWEATKTLR